MGLTDEAIAPILLIECQNLHFQETYRMCLVCHNCFEKLDPDMWIDSLGWESLNPITKFEDLPITDGDGLERWEIAKYIK